MDAVYFLQHSKQGDLEIRNSLRGIARHMSWVRKVWIFGDRPEFLSDDTRIVEHVPHEYVARTGCFRLPVANFFLQCYLSSLIPELSFEYLLFSDDFMLLKDLSPEVARQDRFLEDMSKVKNRGKGLFREALWRTHDVLKRLGYTPVYNFETHVPTYFTKKRVLEAYCEFKDYVTEDRFYGMIGPTSILNHAYRHGAFQLTPLGDSRCGFWGKYPNYEEIVKGCEGKQFFNFDDDAFGPDVQRFLAERFPDPSPYEKATKTSVSVTLPQQLVAGPATVVSSSTRNLEDEIPPSKVKLADQQVVMWSRDEIPTLLNRKGLLGDAAYVNINTGEFACTLLTHWQGRCLHCIRSSQIVLNNPSAESEGHWHDAEWLGQLRRFDARCKLYNMKACGVGNHFADASLDFVYLDSDNYLHRAELLDDVNAWFPKVKEDGLLAGSGYHCGTQIGSCEIKSTIDAWAQDQGLEVFCTGKQTGCTWLIRVLRTGRTKKVGKTITPPIESGPSAD